MKKEEIIEELAHASPELAAKLTKYLVDIELDNY